MRTTVTFREVFIIGAKTGKCGCGKRRTRQQKFWQTLSPLNVNGEGEPKSEREILTELTLERLTWLGEPVVCTKCA